MFFFISLKNDLITLGLGGAKKIFIESRETRTENLLNWIDRFLTKRKTSPAQIKALVVGELDGSFTSTRAIASFVNAFAYVKAAPITRTSREFNAKNFSEILKTPRSRGRAKRLAFNYKSAPSITLKRKA